MARPWLQDFRRLPSETVLPTFGQIPLTAAAIGGNAWIGQPQMSRELAGLPEHVDRYAAARIPKAGNSQEFWSDCGNNSLADIDRASFVEISVGAKTEKKELQGLRFEQ